MFFLKICKPFFKYSSSDAILDLWWPWYSHSQTVIHDNQIILPIHNAKHRVLVLRVTSIPTNYIAICTYKFCVGMYVWMLWYGLWLIRKTLRTNMRKNKENCNYKISIVPLNNLIKYNIQFTEDFMPMKFLNFLILL